VETAGMLLMRMERFFRGVIQGLQEKEVKHFKALQMLWQTSGDNLYSLYKLIRAIIVFLIVVF